MWGIVARESTGSTLTYIMVPIEGYTTRRKKYIYYMYITGCSPQSFAGMSFIFLFNQEANHIALR